jgi:hypothetical protein
MIVPKRPEIGNWKLNVAKNQGSIPKPKITFDMLFDKYSKQKAVTSDRPVKKRMRSSPHQERPASPPGQPSDSEVNHFRGKTLIQMGLLQVQICFALSMMTME